MNTKQTLAMLATSAFVMLSIAISHAATITATGSGNWSSTTPDAPWPGGVVPAPTDDIQVNSPFNVNVDTNETVLDVAGSGTVTLASGVTLNITKDGPTVTGTLVATAADCTVNFQGNPYSVASGTYYNLSLSAFYGTLYNYAGPINVLGTLTLSGNANVQVGNFPWTMNNLVIGSGSKFNCSGEPVTVTNNVVVSGILDDEWAQTTAPDDAFGSVTVNNGGTWNLGDTVEWAISKNLTNNGTITGTAYGGIHFTGTGIITGTSPATPPWLSFEGTTTIENTINLAHSPDFVNTVVFDLANPGQLTCADTLYFGSTLNVINTGGALTTGSSYQIFSAPSYNDPYSFATINLPSLAPGLSWVNSLTTGGSISITGTAGGGAPAISVSRSGGNLTLSWDTNTFAGYTVEVQTNAASVGIGAGWTDTGSGSPFMTTIDPSNPSVLFRLVHP